jgi:hypothetical protein
MRFRTSIMTVAVTVALAVPAVAGSAVPKHHYAPVVVTTLYPGTSSISDGCAMTLVAGHVSSFRCAGSAPRANPGRCTLTVATGRLWTYSCPSGRSGASTGAIPSSCNPFKETGSLWMFSCPTGVFGRTGPAALALSRCTKPLTDQYLSGRRCTL